MLTDAVKTVWFPPLPVPERNRWTRLTRPYLDGALDLLFPLHCAACNCPLESGVNHALCRPCAEQIRWIGADRCSRCGAAVGQGRGVVPACAACQAHPPAFVEASCALASYSTGPLRDLILGVKFGGKLHLLPALADLLCQRICDTGLLQPGMTILPAPLTRTSLYRRGFNQAVELSALVAARLKLPLETRLLKKVRHTPPQATLSHEKRRENLKDAFACTPQLAEKFQSHAVLLIDDVITTGSTIAECARTLNAAGIGPVRAAALARG